MSVGDPSDRKVSDPEKVMKISFFVAVPTSPISSKTERFSPLGSGLLVRDQIGEKNCTPKKSKRC